MSYIDNGIYKERVFNKSKTKVTAMMATFAVIATAFLILFLLVLKEQSYKSAGTTLITAYSITVILMLSKLKPIYNQSLEIRDDEIVFRDPEKNACVVIKIMQIEKLDYYGTSIIPMSEILIIKTPIEKLYIDYNFIDYLDIWSLIVEQCNFYSVKCIIDPKIKRRTSVEK
jgi:hypothetical protein